MDDSKPQAVQLVTVTQLCCLRCGHAWIPRDAGHQPVSCPKCRTKLWNVPRAYQREGKPAPERRRAAPRAPGE